MPPATPVQIEQAFVDVYAEFEKDVHMGIDLPAAKDQLRQIFDRTVKRSLEKPDGWDHWQQGGKTFVLKQVADIAVLAAYLEAFAHKNAIHADAVKYASEWVILNAKAECQLRLNMLGRYCQDYIPGS